MEYYHEMYLFHRGWFRLLSNIIHNITGLELLDGMQSNLKRGVYIILSIDHSRHEVDIEYIGSSVNIQERLYKGKHEVYDKLMDSRTEMRDITVRYIDTNHYEKYEKLLIQSLRPKMNIQHNRSPK
jgi:hypothetical protein